MRCLLSVCLIAVSSAVVLARYGNLAAQEPQKGVSVQLVPTNHATPMPEADSSEAWIVTVMGSGDLYFGARRVAPDILMDEMKRRPHDRDQKLFIKGDGRVPFAKVKSALDIGREALFEHVALLTYQLEPVKPGTTLPPMGLEVTLGAPKAGPDITLVQVHKSNQSAPVVIINQQRIRWEVFPDMLNQVLETQKEKTVALEADGQLTYGAVVGVIDECRGVGAKVILGSPTL
jgi:biopolymer transport protein ExbD